jgi:diguanylate cyclase (GGDEF)-like protein
MVPLLREDATLGALGLIRHNNERWPEEEVDTLVAIASLIAQMWGRHDAESHIAHLAYHDEMTQLPNRRLLTERIAEVESGRSASLLVVDVDNMKVINDGLNYEAGNEFLIEMADRLRTVVRADSLVARLAGDQFGVLVVDSEDSNVEAMAGRLLDELGRPLDIGGISVVRSVSIGVAHRGSLLINDDVDLLKDADVALYDAKRNGKNRVAIFDDAMKRRLSANFELEIQLRQALEAEGELCLHYQPEVDLRTGRVVAVEALMRWNHPERGLLSAGLFIEAAEESGIIVEIGDFVLRESIRQLAEWNEDHPDLVMRVNVSPAQLMSRDLAKQIRVLVGEFGVPADRICIEVTEHVMIIDHKFIMQILNELRTMGVQIALDDFGTGYSSMEQLKRLPIDALKIDRAFMIELASSDKDAAIVDATIRLAEALELDIVAEGIEEEEQVLELLSRGCHRAQGFLLARPAAPEVVSRLLGQRIKAGRLELSEARDPAAIRTSH